MAFDNLSFHRPDRQGKKVVEAPAAAGGKKPLVEALRERIAGEVRFESGDRALYATDGSNYRQVPIGVVIPRSNEDVVQTVALCREYGVPVLSRGGGTSLAGQCCNTAVVIDFSKYLNRVLEIDPARRIARVQPGVVLDELRCQAEQHHLTFAPDPSTHTHNTLGGMIGNNSCGVHSVMGGRTSDNIVELEVLTYRGERLRVGATSTDALDTILQGNDARGELYRKMRGLRDRYADLIRQRYPDIPRRVSGYNLDDLLPEKGFNVARALVGSEGTLVVVLEATVRLVPSPPARTLVVLGYKDVFQAADHVPQVMQHGPVGLEGLDARLVSDMRIKGLNTSDIPLLPPGRGWLLVEFGGDDKAQADAKGRALIEALAQGPEPPSHKLYDDMAQEEEVWTIRESGLGATAHIPGQHETWPGWEDSAVAPEKFGAYLREFKKLLDRYGYSCAMYGHFGQGCLHCRIDFELTTAGGLEKWRAFLMDAADLVAGMGGSLSGEHGDGQQRGALLERMYGPEIIEAFREFKGIWDPDGRMNPGKVVDAYRVDENLRLGTDYRPPLTDTYFKYPEDQYDFPRATLRCVGIGNCRQHGGGVMCPSYMATREEKHSTRGRARLLFEMLKGDVIKDGWQEESVRDALSLCLSCKGCRGECPVNVDMATYKAEFLAHYYEKRRRPLHAYAFGWIDRWSRLASAAPGLTNAVTHGPGLSTAVKWALNMPQQRDFPHYARQTFRDWAKGRRAAAGAGRKTVILWPDTFNNHFHPGSARSALRVLEDAGFEVRVPEQPLCCGRPLYEYGMLKRAKARLQEILDALGDEIRAGVPIVGIEPSCMSVFREELISLFPHDLNAQRLRKQTFLLSEFLDRHGYKPPPLGGRAVVQAHCHHRAIFKTRAQDRLLNDLGLKTQRITDGCCGVAGGFGFEADKYEVSIRCAERDLLPAVRAADSTTLLVVDGFSCREQIRQTTGRHALHFADVLAQAIERKAR